MPEAVAKASGKYRARLQAAKQAARSELALDHWGREGYALPAWTHALHWVQQQNVDRLHVPHTSARHFRQVYEAPGIPCVLVGGMDHWPAYQPEHSHAWSVEGLRRRFHHERFKVGQDDAGKAVYLRLDHFLDYCTRPGDAEREDSPLYIFDPNFGARTNNNGKSRYNALGPPRKTVYGPGDSLPCCRLLQDYEVPAFFEGEDLFALADPSRRPPYRWVVIGPARSGSWMHTDPLGTSAWNALVSGHKRWALFPPGTPTEAIEPPRSHDREAVTWFARVLPTLTDPSTLDEQGRTLAQRLGLREILQAPGEIVFVPAGWHHVVLNLNLTVAVTQNFASLSSLEIVWLRTRHARPKLAQHLLRALRRRARHGCKGDARAHEYREAVRRIRALDTVPALPESSSDSGSSSTSLSESSGLPTDVEEEGEGHADKPGTGRGQCSIGVGTQASLPALQDPPPSVEVLPSFHEYMRAKVEAKSRKKAGKAKPSVPRKRKSGALDCVMIRGECMRLP